MSNAWCRIANCANPIEDPDDDLGVCPSCGLRIARRYRVRLNAEDFAEANRQRALAEEQEARRAAQLAAITADLFKAQEEPGQLELVYYVRIGEHIKIGYSKNLRSRLSALRVQVSDLLAAEPGGRTLEQQRHQDFDHLRVSKRWENFTPAPDLDEHISRLRDQYGLPQWLRAPHRGRNGPVVVRSIR